MYPSPNCPRSPEMPEDETEFWPSVAGIRESIAQAKEDIAAGRAYTEAEIRAELATARRRPCGWEDTVS